jgi:hypothetical protein
LGIHSAAGQHAADDGQQSELVSKFVHHKNYISFLWRFTMVLAFGVRKRSPNAFFANEARRHFLSIHVKLHRGTSNLCAIFSVFGTIVGFSSPDCGAGL